MAPLSFCHGRVCGGSKSGNLPLKLVEMEKKMEMEFLKKKEKKLLFRRK